MHKSHAHEIAMVSSLVVRAVNIEGPTDCPDANRLETFTAIRALKSSTGGTQSSWPLDLQSTLAKVKGKTKPLLCASEKALLNLMIARVHQEDPDVLVAHGLHGSTL